MKGNRKRVLIITNLQTRGNPALLNIFKLLKNEFDITISGSEKSKDAYKEFDTDFVIYSNLSWIYRFFKMVILLIPYVVLKSGFDVNKAKARLKIVNHKIIIGLNRFEFNLKFRTKVDFVINIDTDATFISESYRLKYKIPSAYFIYEFYADQFLEAKDEFYSYCSNFESKMIQSSDLILSSCNEIFGQFLLDKYNIKKDMLVFTICPNKVFSDEIKLNDPIRFYYHGALYTNRGLEDSIKAFQHLEGATLSLRGYGPNEDELRRLVNELKLENKVFFLDPVPTDQLPMMATQFDIGLTLVRMNVLNHTYAIGFKTFENIAAGLALILPESYPLKRLNQDFSVGLTYPDATVEHLEKVFKYCVENKDQVLQWKLNSRKAYEQEYNPEIQKQKLVSSIEKLIAQ